MYEEYLMINDLYYKMIGIIRCRDEVYIVRSESPKTYEKKMKNIIRQIQKSKQEEKEKERKHKN